MSPWASLLAQMVKNLPAMQETRVRSLGGEDPLENGTENPMDRRACWIYGVAKSQTRLSD